MTDQDQSIGDWLARGQKREPVFKEEPNREFFAGGSKYEEGATEEDVMAQLGYFGGNMVKGKKEVQIRVDVEVMKELMKLMKKNDTHSDVIARLIKNQVLYQAFLTKNNLYRKFEDFLAKRD
jgi:hypothetical protein